MSNTNVLTAIAANKELVVKTCLENVYEGSCPIDRVASIVVETLGFDVVEVAKVWANVEAIETLIKAIWDNSLTGVWASACEEMTEFLAALTQENSGRLGSLVSSERGGKASQAALVAYCSTFFSRINRLMAEERLQPQPSAISFSLFNSLSSK